MKKFEGSKLTTSSGVQLDDDMNIMTAGERGPAVLSDYQFLDKMAHFDRERIPERVVHAKGSGAYGHLKITKDMSKYTKAKLFKGGMETPLALRFSTVGGEKGSADSERDPRGFAIKLYTEEGNYDIVGNNTPIFFIRDPTKFPDFIHTQKRNPETNCKDANMFWDFLSQTPESLQQVSFLFSNRGTPYGYRHMNGYGSHTFVWVNDKNEKHFVKYHFKTDQGIKNLSAQEADEFKKNPDYAQQDLFETIEKGGPCSWTFKVQILTYEEGMNFKFDIFDVTKIWPHSLAPEIEIGKLVLNRNAKNYFQEIEQLAFSPGNFIPGIEASFDKMLQGRIFSYGDTQRHRLGANYNQLPVNCPYRANASNGQRDGPMSFNNQGSAPNYQPSSFHPYKMTQQVVQIPVSGMQQRYKFSHPNTDFEQTGTFWNKVLNDKEKTDLVNNIVGALKGANKNIQERQVQLFYKCDPVYGERIAQGVNVSVVHAKL